MRLRCSFVFLLILLISVTTLSCGPAVAAKSEVPIYLKLEVEDFGGFGQYKLKSAAWSHRMAWYPQWSRGGDSGWWAAQGEAIATSGEVTLDFYIPRSGEYTLWVRYEDYPGQQEPFDVMIKHAGGQAKAELGRADKAQREGNYPYFYVWVDQPVKLEKGPATAVVSLPGAAPVRRAVDAIVLTTDKSWKPEGRAFPPQGYSEYLLNWGKTRKHMRGLVAADAPVSVPPAWQLPKTGKRDFWYLGADKLVPGFPKPININNEPAGIIERFVSTYGSNPQRAPIFSSPVCGVKVAIGEVRNLVQPSDPMRQYILHNKVPFVVVGNYASAGQVKNSYDQLKQVFGDLWVGIVSGEGSYLSLPLHPQNVPAGTNYKKTNYDWLFGEGKDKWRQAMSADWASDISNPFEKLILCSSVGTIMNIHRMAESGSQVLGTESAAAMPYAQQQLAFARGAGRQYGRRWMWYYGASFGDAIRTFTPEGAYVLDLEGLKVDNRNSTIGPSLAHIRRVMLHSYLQGASLFMPEQGYNLIGPDAKLNPMGWPYDEMIRLATRHPDRGVVYTPIGVLMDHAHGWEKYDYYGMHIWTTQPLARADRMIDGFFNVAYYPFPKNEGEPADDMKVCWPNGYFGDLFDVLVTSPTKLDIIKSYPVLFCVGDTRLDGKWTQALKDYVQTGGTLVINADQVVPAMDDAFLGARRGNQTKEADEVVCEPDHETLASAPFPYRQATATTAKVIAKTPDGDPVAMVNRVGSGRVILTTQSYMLGLDMEPTPYLARLLLHVTSGLSPVEVRGNCQHYVNLHPQGYLVVVSNNEGISKLSHSPANFDASKASDVQLIAKSRPAKTEDWIGEDPQNWSFPNEWLSEYTQPVTLDWKEESGGRFTANVRLRPGEIRAFLIRTR